MIKTEYSSGDVSLLIVVGFAVSYFGVQLGRYLYQRYCNFVEQYNRAVRCLDRLEELQDNVDKLVGLGNVFNIPNTSNTPNTLLQTNPETKTVDRHKFDHEVKNFMQNKGPVPSLQSILDEIDEVDNTHNYSKQFKSKQVPEPKSQYTQIFENVKEYLSKPETQFAIATVTPLLVQKAKDYFYPPQLSGYCDCELNKLPPFIPVNHDVPSVPFQPTPANENMAKLFTSKIPGGIGALLNDKEFEKLIGNIVKTKGKIPSMTDMSDMTDIINNEHFKNLVNKFTNKDFATNNDNLLSGSVIPQEDVCDCPVSFNENKNMEVDI